MHPPRQARRFQQAGYSNIGNQEPAVFVQDTWQVTHASPSTMAFAGRRSSSPIPSSHPRSSVCQIPLRPEVPLDRLSSQSDEQFQPRVGFAYDIFGGGKSVLRGSAGIFNARQNMLTEVGAITTNGVQQQTLQASPQSIQTCTFCPLSITGCPFAGVTVFDKNYHNPRIYSYDVAYEQQLGQDYVVFRGLRPIRRACT